MAKPRQVNLYEAKTKLSALVKAAAAGATIVIARDGEPVAQLVPLSHGARPVRKPGTWAGKAWMADDFDAPLPANVQALLDGEDPAPRAPLRDMMARHQKK